MTIKERVEVISSEIIKYKFEYPQTQKIKLKIQKLQQELNELTLSQ